MTSHFGVKWITVVWQITNVDYIKLKKDKMGQLFNSQSAFTRPRAYGMIEFHVLIDLDIHTKC